MTIERGTRASALARVLRLDRRRRRLLPEAAIALAVATAVIRLLPFRRAVRLGSSPRRSRDEASAEAIRWSIEAAAARLPFRTVCFQRGLALQWMLRRRGIDARLHYGVGYSPDGELRAHVWVEADGRIVIGGEEAPGYRCVASYPE